MIWPVEAAAVSLQAVVGPLEAEAADGGQRISTSAAPPRHRGLMSATRQGGDNILIQQTPWVPYVRKKMLQESVTSENNSETCEKINE